MTSERLGEMFKGDSADTCAGKFLFVSMGGRANGQACADGERGPPLARTEILNQRCMSFSAHIFQPDLTIFVTAQLNLYLSWE
jgi:hypothetical protein